MIMLAEFSKPRQRELNWVEVLEETQGKVLDKSGANSFIQEQ